MLESVEFLSQLKSSRSFNDKDLINNNSDLAVIYAEVDFNQKLKIDLFRKGSKKVYVNDGLLKKQSHIKNYIRSVCFSSNDLDIVKGEPNYRRVWLDKVVAQLEPVYVELLSRYNKLLKQRSHFWRSNISKDTSHKALIDSFDTQMALVGTRIIRRRNRALNKLKPYIEDWHRELSKSQENIQIKYISSIKSFDNNDDEEAIMNVLVENLLQQRNIEELTGKCSIGPHRDDIDFIINDQLVRKFGSSGQQRTVTLSLKMAEIDVLKNIILVDPILILDDVLAELDVARQSLLLNAVGEKSQCIISATHIDRFHKSLLENSQIISL